MGQRENGERNTRAGFTYSHTSRFLVLFLARPEKKNVLFKLSLLSIHNIYTFPLLRTPYLPLSRLSPTRGWDFPGSTFPNSISPHHHVLLNVSLHSWSSRLQNSRYPGVTKLRDRTFPYISLSLCVLNKSRSLFFPSIHGVHNSERGENWDFRGLRIGLLVPPAIFQLWRLSHYFQRLVVDFRCCK